MAGYGYSTPYSGMAGGPLPAGYLEAATLPGKYLAKGITDFGAGIGAAIRKYQQDKAERDYAQSGMEAALAPYIDQHLSGPPTAEGVEPWAQRAADVVGAKNIKKIASGKLSTADMLAIKHSLETHQDRQLKDLQLQQLQNVLNEQAYAVGQRNKVAAALQGVQTDRDVHTPSFLPVLDKDAYTQAQRDLSTDPAAMDAIQQQIDKLGADLSDTPRDLPATMMHPRVSEDTMRFLANVGSPLVTPMLTREAGVAHEIAKRAAPIAPAVDALASSLQSSIGPYVPGPATRAVLSPMLAPMLERLLGAAKAGSDLVEPLTATKLPAMPGPRETPEQVATRQKTAAGQIADLQAQQEALRQAATVSPEAFTGQVEVPSVGTHKEAIPIPEQEANLAKALRLSGVTDPKTMEGAMALFRAGRGIGSQMLPGGIMAITNEGQLHSAIKVGLTPEQQKDLLARQIPGTNWFAPTEAEGVKFRESMANVMAAKTKIARLLEIANIPGKTLDPELRSEAQGLASELAGMMRVEVLGPGTVNAQERQILESLAPDPTALWNPLHPFRTMDSAKRVALHKAAVSLDNSLTAKARSLGFINGTGADLSGALGGSAAPAKVWTYDKATNSLK